MVTSTEPASASWLAVLLAASFVTGVFILVTARLISRPGRILAARKRVSGLLLEMWLYGDEPAQVLRTQFALISANLRYVSAVAPVVLASAPPVALLWFTLDPVLGHRPLQPDESVIVTLPAGQSSAEARISVPRGFTIETPPVRSMVEGTVSWRVRASAEASGELSASIGPTRIARHLEASRKLLGPSPYWDAVVDYPKRRATVLGVEWPWPVWLVILSTMVAFSLRKRFGVHF